MYINLRNMWPVTFHEKFY